MYEGLRRVLGFVKLARLRRAGWAENREAERIADRDTCLRESMMKSAKNERFQAQ